MRLVWGEWASRVTGSLSAVLVLVGLGVSVSGALGYDVPQSSIIQLGTWLLAAVCGGQAAYSVWAKEHTARMAAEAKLKAHSHGLAFSSSLGFDGMNEENMLEVRTDITNKSDVPISWYLKNLKTSMEHYKLSEDIDKGPYTLHRGSTTTWFPNRGLSKQQYTSLPRENLGELFYEIEYGVPGEPRDRLAKGTFKLRLIKGVGRADLHWEIGDNEDRQI